MSVLHNNLDSFCFTVGPDTNSESSNFALSFKNGLPIRDTLHCCRNFGISFLISIKEFGLDCIESIDKYGENLQPNNLKFSNRWM